MTAADDLWAAVKNNYDEQMLISLTNVRKRENAGIEDSVGTSAAQSVINWYPIIVQADYDEGSAQHVEVGMVGVIAMLWRRGGSAANAEKIRWEDWVQLAETLKGVEPRAHGLPESGDVNGKDCSADPACPPGCRPMGWADKAAFRHLLPRSPGCQRDPTEWM
jgi:hypothetical protein